ncbi:glycoside hydrolase family 28 protein [Saccharicrinis fermentans]|uniref:Endo-polygalacturonase n=1 Tax=Saccharicrinis fermentans DSM 9555 = JCM 21142 TaxID=869213 RepID=W7Y2D8_9BACT|nr:glycosyl hydrolase family 28 protein [Saccharicrinis fermentans]GAF02107.1 endo-polygalacturonase precursor [Saccharicrinis fermentans DSM 9555 = JCM 21142]
MKTMLLLLLTIHLTCAYTQNSETIPHFEWMDQVGAHSQPNNKQTFLVNDFGAIGDAITMNTQAIQNAINQAEKAGGGTVTFQSGIYLSGSLFIGDNINFHIPKGTMIIGSQDLKDYKCIDTRVAGIEMNWPAALINIIGKKNAAITGDGVIHGKGKVFWDKYWSMRKEYEAKQLRWIVDYDCDRPRGILISDSENITVDGIVLYQPGFWSLHILYSKYVTVNDITISNNIEGHGPSTDGIDIDSSSFILVQNSTINCNDDNICLKAGRDADGLKVNRPCEYIVIRNCTAGLGAGLFTCGSETSGDIKHVVAYNLIAQGTTFGLRFKSTTQRGGNIEDIHLANITMQDVKYPLSVDLNWNPAYSNSLLPESYNNKEIPAHWLKMLEKVDPQQGMPKFKNIHFSHIKCTNAESCITIEGIKKSTIDHFSFNHVSIQGKKAGHIKYAKNWICNNLQIISDEVMILKNNKKVNLFHNEEPYPFK